jgi:hypothetical protein
MNQVVESLKKFAKEEYPNGVSLDDLLQEVNVDLPDGHELVSGWFMVSTPNEGVVACFADQGDAFKYRLDLINTVLNT